MEIGAKLKEARLAKGLTLENVEAETKIRRKYITALEEERFDLLPGKVYAKAFLKTYVRFLGIELGAGFSFPREVFEDDHPAEREEMMFTRIPKKDSQPTGFLWRMVIGLSVVAGLAMFLLIGSWVVGTNLANRGQDSKIGDNTPAVAQQPEEIDLVEEPSPQIDPTRLVLDFNIKNRPCWILVLIDGAEQFQGTLQPGETKRFEGEGIIKARFGDAGAVEVFQNGENLGMMSNKSEVVDKEFVLEINE
ncbi:MAG: DUF4115 domain-containing protein [Peptococcaceae bacterium]|nr:DUF4115 domain-containing protein [Peptococcaceae bacterium]